MTNGTQKSRSKKRVYKRVPGGKSVLTYREKRSGKPTCPTGRELPGTARGNKAEVRKFTKSQRRPSRPFGGVLSSPAMREVLKARVAEEFHHEGKTVEKVYSPGVVCIKTAGRDAGKLCVITDVVDAHFVKVGGDARARKVNIKHLEPTGKVVDPKKDFKAQL